MTAAAFTRRSKAMTIVPVALLSAAWSASLVANSAAVGAAGVQQREALPDGTTVPQQAIQAPASVPLPGHLGMGVPAGSADSVVAGATATGIPAPALAAYQRAAQIIDSADKQCNIPWELIAAIGRVESDHGQYGGSHLTADGLAKPGILGPVLDGHNNTQLIRDTDGGLLDGDPVYDRAVGPMQFIPSTWQVVKVDADNDGKRNPQDIDDASLATAVYLCSGSDNLATRTGQEAAVYRYNHSHDYVSLVLRIMEAYASGNYTAVQAGGNTYAGALLAPSYASAIDERRQAARTRIQRGGSHTAPSARQGSGSSDSTATATATSKSGSSTPDGSTTTQPTLPRPTGGASDPVKQVTQGLKDGAKSATSALPAPVQSAAAPVTDTLSTLSEAAAYCAAHLPALNSNPAVVNDCAAKLQGMTTTQASSTIPGTKSDVLSWLGLPALF